jgi:alkylation response protein AidB-like acyl-CoA dehydrogenase
LPELAVVVEELGRVVAPGPFLPTVLAAAVIASAGSAGQQEEWLPGLADGSIPGAVGLDGDLGRSREVLDGDAGVVVGGGLARVLLLPVGADLAIVDRRAAGIGTTAQPFLDPTRRGVRVLCSATPAPDDRMVPGGRAVARRLARVLAAAEAVGGAHACTEMAVAYAKVREQFGRTIGTFQAVKHHCANMLVDAELATAATWDAARGAPDTDEAELIAAVAAAVALPAYLRCAQTNIQVHGGIGYTWEHDAHLYLRRAAALLALWGPETDATADVARLAAAGVRRRYAIDLPPEAESYRAEARAFLQQYRALPLDRRHRALVDSGYFVPHWPRPWGRAAGAVEQLVIDEELAGVERANMGITGWVTLTLAQHGSPDQVERWVGPTLDGELTWCQLFSEPNAGSDAAAIQTRARRVEGGWLVNGQKVWTSGAQHCNRGFATVRTDPDAPKHAGVSMMVVDMGDPCVEVRPLREITGNAMFNEVFFNDVFVPDDDVVGPVNQGWRVARATLGNERVSIGGGDGPGGSAYQTVELLERYAPDDGGLRRQVGALVAEEQAMSLINLRQAARAVEGAEPGPEGNVTKLLSAEHAQRIAAVGMAIAGGAAVGGDEADLAELFLFTRCLTIAGGTSEIVRNQIAERILRLPRDPLIS